MKKTILLSLAITSLTLSGFAQEKKSKFGSFVDKAAQGVKKELTTPAAGSSTTPAAGSSSGSTESSSSGSSASAAQSGSGSFTPGSATGPRPVNATITNKKSRLYTAADGAMLYTTCEAPSGDLQKNNLDKILFGKARINKDGTTAQISNTFHAGENIYGRAFMRSCMMNYKVYMTSISPEASKCMEGRFDVNVSIDGKDAGMLMESQLSGEMEAKSTFTIITVGAGDDADANNEEFIKQLNALSVGSHNIKLTVWATQGDFISVDPVAMGEFTYVKDAGSAKVGLGRNFGAVKEGMQDAALQAKMLKKINEHAKANGWKETFTDIKIQDEDWSTIRNELTSIVVGRSIDFAAKAKWPDGHCTYQIFSVKEDYDGANYSNALQMGGIGDQTEIDCN